MKIIDRFKNVFSKSKEDENPQNVSSEKVRSLIADVFFFGITPSFSYWLFDISNSISNSVNLIAWTFSLINPILKDKESGEIIKSHDVLDLENFPDPRISKSSLRYGLMQSLCLTGEIYPVLLGNVKYEPAGIYYYPACSVDSLPGHDNFPTELYITQYNFSKILKRVLKNRQYLFQDSTGLMEIKFIFSSLKPGDVRAQNPLEQIVYQALTKHYGHLHNTSMLKNGNRPSGIMSPKGQNFTDNQYQMFKQEVRKNLSGPVNAGECITAPTPIEYTNLMTNTRDMDFINLISECNVDIYNQFHIPLPLVLKETMTLSNYTKAVEAFLDFAVLPKAIFIWENYGDYLLSRFKDGHRFKFEIDERQISQLRERLFARLKDMDLVGSFTEDEKRNSVGYENLAEGDGNTIYRSAGKIPYNNEDVYFNDSIRYEGSLKRPEEIDYEENESEKEFIACTFEEIKIEGKPFENEYSCRLKDPSQYDEFRRENNAGRVDGKRIDFIWGLKKGKAERQAIRYPKKEWTKEEAQKHCGKHEHILFE